MRVRNTAGMTFTLLLPPTSQPAHIKTDEERELPESYRDCPQCKMLMDKGWLVEVLPEPEPEPVPEPEPAPEPKPKRSRRKKREEPTVEETEEPQDEPKADD